MEEETRVDNNVGDGDGGGDDDGEHNLVMVMTMVVVMTMAMVMTTCWWRRKRWMWWCWRGRRSRQARSWRQGKVFERPQTLSWGAWTVFLFNIGDWLFFDQGARFETSAEEYKIVSCHKKFFLPSFEANGSLQLWGGRNLFAGNAPIWITTIDKPRATKKKLNKEQV